jgi:hypothetical protein
MVAMAQFSPLSGAISTSLDQISGAVHVIWQLAEFCRHLATLLKKLAGFFARESIQWSHLPEQWAVVAAGAEMPRSSL